MNKVILMGRLTRNPDIRYSQSENSLAVARFTLAVDRRFKRDNEATADFISCVAFGKTADFFEKYTRQGTKVCLEGRIQTGSYVKQDGTKVYTTDVVVDNVEFAESKAASSNQGYYDQNQSGQDGMNQSYQQPQGGQYGQPRPQQPQGGSYSQSPAPQYQQNQGIYSQDYAPQAPAGPDQQPRDGFYQQGAPMQEAADEGFMQIPDELSDEGLPFN